MSACSARRRRRGSRTPTATCSACTRSPVRASSRPGRIDRVDEQTRARRAACTTFLGGDGSVQPAELLASIPADVSADSYGEGGAVTDLERYVAELLGKPAAVFVPSGTMAQGAT